MTDSPVEERLEQRWRRYRHTLLLAMLVLDILIAPIVMTISSAEHPLLGVRIQLGFFSALVIVAVATTRHRPSRRLAFALGVPTLASAWLKASVDSLAVRVTADFLGVSFLLLLVVLLVVHVFRQRIISFDVISASLCAYLLIGLAWASVYALIETYQPGSFSLPEDGLPGFAAHDVDASVRRVYFSFVTLVTLGYGDLVPTGSLARLSAVVEAFVGQTFMVVLVARLVGINVGQAMAQESSSDS